MRKRTRVGVGSKNTKVAPPTRKTKIKLAKETLDKLSSGVVFDNYKELCEALSIPLQEGNSKKAQLKELECYFSWTKIGRKFIINEVYDKPKRRPISRHSCTTKHNGIGVLLFYEFLMNNKTSKLYYSIDPEKNTQTWYVSGREFYKYCGLTNNNWNERFAKQTFKDLDIQETPTDKYTLTAKEVNAFIDFVHNNLYVELKNLISILDDRYLIDVGFPDVPFYEIQYEVKNDMDETKGIRSTRMTTEKESRQIRLLAKGVLDNYVRQKKISRATEYLVHGSKYNFSYLKELKKVCKQKYGFSILNSLIEITIPIVYTGEAPAFYDLSSYTSSSLKDNILTYNSLFLEKLNGKIIADIEELDLPPDIKALELMKKKRLLDYFVKLSEDEVFHFINNCKNDEYKYIDMMNHAVDSLDNAEATDVIEPIAASIVPDLPEPKESVM